MSFNTYDYPESAKLYARAKEVIPSGIYGHQGPAEACFIPTTAYPLFSEKCKDSYFWDADGNRFIDYINAYGANILGYCNEEVNTAALKQSLTGDIASVPNKIMVEFAELLVDTVSSADWAFFAKNGSDACTLAIMTARAHTGRSKIIFLNHHNHGKDPWAQKLDSRGVISEDVQNNIFVPFNDVTAFEKVVSENYKDIAAFIATPYMFGNFTDSEIPAEGYWQKIREICTKYGILLIIDDTRTCFRLDTRGSDYHYGFKADLIILGSSIANGWSVSALCGNNQFKATVSGIHYTGTTWLSAAPFAAGIVCVNKLREIDAPKVFKGMADKLLPQLLAAAKNEDFNLLFSGEPSNFYMRITDDNNLILHQKWVAEMVKRGVFMTIHHTHCFNATLSDEDIKRTAEVAADAFNALRKTNGII